MFTGTSRFLPFPLRGDTRRNKPLGTPGAGGHSRRGLRASAGHSPGLRGAHSGFPSWRGRRRCGDSAAARGSRRRRVFSRGGGGDAESRNCHRFSPLSCPRGLKQKRKRMRLAGRPVWSCGPPPPPGRDAPPRWGCCCYYCCSDLRPRRVGRARLAGGQGGWRPGAGRPPARGAPRAPGTRGGTRGPRAAGPARLATQGRQRVAGLFILRFPQFPRQREEAGVCCTSYSWELYSDFEKWVSPARKAGRAFNSRQSSRGSLPSTKAGYTGGRRYDGVRTACVPEESKRVRQVAHPGGLAIAGKSQR